MSLAEVGTLTRLRLALSKHEPDNRDHNRQPEEQADNPQRRGQDNPERSQDEADEFRQEPDHLWFLVPVGDPPWNSDILASTRLKTQAWVYPQDSGCLKKPPHLAVSDSEAKQTA